MKKILEVREFDKICCNSNYQTEYAYLPEPVFRDLLESIRIFSTTDQDDILDFLKVGRMKKVGETVSVNNYVGLIQLHNGYQIQVLPKIDFGVESDNGNKETKRIFLKMLRSMKDFPSRVFNDSNLNMERMTLYEVFINMYLQEVRALVKKGLKSAYIARQDNLNVFKGKLISNRHIIQNVAHQERFYVQYDEYHVDRAENRLIKSTLLKLHDITTLTENQKEIKQLLLFFEKVNPSANYEKDFSRIVIDRNTKGYDILMKWSRVFLLNKSFTTFSGNTNARALLFQMEKLFESYVTQQLKKALKDDKWDISSQDKGYYLFDSPKRFSLRPDIVIKRSDGSIVVLDAKWKNLVNNVQKNYGISQADMYQMYAYSKKYNTAETWLLYPVNTAMRGHSDISFKSKDDVQVNLFFVDVAHIENSMKMLRKRLLK